MGKKKARHQSHKQHHIKNADAQFARINFMHFRITTTFEGLFITDGIFYDTRNL